MELRLCIYISMLLLGTGLCLAFSQADGEFLLKCSNKTSTSRPSDWTATQAVNGSRAYCQAVSPSMVSKPGWTDTYLVIVFIVAGAMAGVSLTLCVINLKLLRHKSKSLAKQRKNATELKTASRNTLHYYESLGSLAIDSRHRVYQNQNSLEGHTLSPGNTYINVPLTSLEHHHLYINTDEEEIHVPHEEVHYAVSKTSKQSENELSTLRPVSIIDLVDSKDTHIPVSTVSPTTGVSYIHNHKCGRTHPPSAGLSGRRVSHLTHSPRRERAACVLSSYSREFSSNQIMSANDQLDSENDNNGYIIPITPTNSQLSLSPSVTFGDEL